MAKHIMNQTLIDPALGYPFTEVKKDEKGQPEFDWVDKLDPETDTPVRDDDGKIVRRKEFKTVDLDTAMAMSLFLSSAYPANPGKESRFDPPTMTDSKNAVRLMKAVTACRKGEIDYIEIESGDMDWLLKAVEERGPAVFGLKAAFFLDAFKTDHVESEIAEA